jgi:transposase-like protein
VGDELPVLPVVHNYFPHEAAREWEAKLAPVLSEIRRKQRRGRVGRSWYCDETYLKVKGRWTYLYRAIDRDGSLVDVYLSESRDRAAARHSSDLLAPSLTSCRTESPPMGTALILELFRSD